MSQRQRRLARSVRLNLLLRRLVALGILAALLGCLYLIGVWAVHRINGYRIGFATARIGTLEDAARARSIIIGDEEVVNAPANGRFENLLMEGERVRKGTVVGYFYPDGAVAREPIKSSWSGIICYHPDGLEKRLAALRPDNMDATTLSLKATAANDGGFDFVKGQPLFKVVDNLAPVRLVMFFKGKTFKEPKEEQEYLLRNDKKDLGWADCEYFARRSGGSLVVLSMAEYPEVLINTRKPYLECVGESYDGIIVPATALTKNHKVWGLYRLEGDVVTFQEVQVLYQKQGKAVIEGIDMGDQVITTPKLVRDGMIIQQ
ncbi:MAG: HlyD family efflux transporter periplasmic adaptor subunit [Chitinophagales bacterium]